MLVSVSYSTYLVHDSQEELSGELYAEYTVTYSKGGRLFGQIPSMVRGGSWEVRTSLASWINIPSSAVSNRRSPPSGECAYGMTSPGTGLNNYGCLRGWISPYSPGTTQTGIMPE
jgi:hypothetical protein